MNLPENYYTNVHYFISFVKGFRAHSAGPGSFDFVLRTSLRMTQEGGAFPSAFGGRPLAAYFPFASSSRIYWSVRSFSLTCSTSKSLVLLELNSVSVLRSVSPLLKYLS